MRITSASEAARAIANMTVRGAPLIGVTAAYGLALQAGEDASDAALEAAAAMLKAARPTAVNLGGGEQFRAGLERRVIAWSQMPA